MLAVLLDDSSDKYKDGARFRSSPAERTLEVGHRIVAFYESRSQAIHWDGRNDFGEGMASWGVGGGYADGGEMEGSKDAGALCASGTGRTGGGGEVQGW